MAGPTAENPPPDHPVGGAWFRAGTKVMTLRGEVPIENVHTADRVVTLSGNGSTLKPVAAVLRRDIDLDRHPLPLQASPVRISAGAIEPGMPIRDLVVAPGEALCLEDGDGERVLVPALYLVNGATIRREPATGSIAYWQVALEEHDILMADGMAAESAVALEPAPSPRGSVVQLRPAAPDPAAEAPANLLPGGRDTATCVKLVLGNNAAPFHARLLAVAEASGFVLSDDPQLALTVDGAELAALSANDGEFFYLLPPGAAGLELRSRTSSPIETNLVGGDTRQLGVAIARIVHDGKELPLDGPACAAGFLPAEHDGANAWRWTTGDATLALVPGDVETTLEIHLQTGWAKYMELTSCG